jgi:Cof subfamily protein (haloacid dehalogenase superfamily)
VRYRLLVTDVDGTLVDHRQEIPPRNLEAIARYQAAGGLVAIATGRIAASARRYVLQTGTECPAILYNGGQIYDFAQERLLFEQVLPAEPARAVWQLLTGRVDYAAYAGGVAYTPLLSGVMAEYARKDRLSLQPLPPEGLPPGSVAKFLIIADPAHLDQIQTAIRALYPNANLVRSEWNYLELLPEGISKGAALPVLAGMLGISPEQVVAVGDNLNDLTMLQTAGLGVAVANAHPDLKAVAGHVVCSCEQGAVAEVIDRFCLGTDP